MTTPSRIRARCLLLAVVAGVLSVAISPGHAEDFKIASYDSSRTFEFQYYGGTTARRDFTSYPYYSSIRAILQDPTVLYKGDIPPARGGPNGPFDWNELTLGQYQGVEIVSPMSVASQTTLQDQGIDLLIMTEVTPLSGAAAAAEYQAIRDFVLDGGCLVIVADTVEPNVVGMANSLLSVLDGGGYSSGPVGRFGADRDKYPQGSTAGYFVDWESNGRRSEILHSKARFPTKTGDPIFSYYEDGTHWSTSGPLDMRITDEDVSDARLGASLNVEVIEGSLSHTLAYRTRYSWRGDTPFIVETQLGQLGPDAGGVLLVGDTIWTDQFVFPGLSNSNYRNINNASLLLNFMVQQMNTIPEPSQLVLLISGGLCAVGIALLRRRRAKSAA